jgi:hypothetical protein
MEGISRLDPGNDVLEFSSGEGGVILNLTYPNMTGNLRKG